MNDIRRYWDEENKKFFYSGWHKDENGNEYYKSLPDFALRNKKKGDACTGLYDKNNNLIFQGDIIIPFDARHPECDFSCSKSQIIFKDGHFCERNPYNDFYLSNKCQHEIIGNSYENPELLEEKCTH